jgi:quinol monooxygenase YgiN
MTACFSVKPGSLGICRQAIEDFIAYIRDYEPATRLYTSLQDSENETEFLHYFVFGDATAEEKHRTSDGVKRFTSILYPELSSDGVEFKRYTLAASTNFS